MNLRARARSGALLAATLLAAGCSNPVADEEHAFNVVGVELIDPAQPATPAARSVSISAWDGAIEVPVGATRTFDVRFLTNSGGTFNLGGAYSARIRFTADAPDTGATVRENDVVRMESLGTSVRVTGRSPGEVSASVVLWHGSHDDRAYGGLPIRVVAP